MATKTFNTRIKQKADTTANWATKTEFIPFEGEIIIYTDRFVTTDDGNTVYYPGVKIGDGNAYVVDLPFIDDYKTATIVEQLNDHVNDTNIHTSLIEKSTWNDKISCEIDDEILIFTK